MHTAHLGAGLQPFRCSLILTSPYKQKRPCRLCCTDEENPAVPPRFPKRQQGFRRSTCAVTGTPGRLYWASWLFFLQARGRRSAGAFPGALSAGGAPLLWARPAYSSRSTPQPSIHQPHAHRLSQKAWASSKISQP